MGDKKIYTAIRYSGKGLTFDAGRSREEVLDFFYDEFIHAGGGFDHINKLLENGNIVVEKGLCDMAYSYGQYKHEQLKIYSENLTKKSDQLFSREPA